MFWLPDLCFVLCSRDHDVLHARAQIRIIGARARVCVCELCKLLLLDCYSVFISNASAKV